MLTLVSASLMSMAMTMRTPCPDGRFVAAGQNCAIYGSYTFYFERGRADVTPTMAAMLDNALVSWRSAPETRIRLSGHTDRAGAAAPNLRLSRRRAENVRRYLVSRGVPEARIMIEAFGETRPLVQTADGVREPQNSRVEFEFVRPD
jgi:outer membrane protein OmpA-like peptidoglycan-associated protein